jgi:tetratricopeptide (TPR) repeat protein
MKTPTLHIILILCFILLTVLAFWKALETPFFWDDEPLILYNPYLGRATGLVQFFSPEYWRTSLFPKDYRPIEMYSYSFDYLFWRKNPVGFHFTNILLHIFNCFSVYVLVNFLFRRKLLAALTSLIFAIQPIHSEAVIWIQNRSELLVSCLSIVSIIAFIRYITNERGKSLFLPISSIAFALAFLTKESAIIVPPLCAAALLPFHNVPRKRLRRGFLQLIVIAAVLFSIKFILLRQGRFEEALPYLYGGLLCSFFAVTKTIIMYLSMLVLPVNLSIDRGFAIPGSQLLLSPLLYSSVVLLIILFVTSYARRRNAASFALCFIFISFIPICNIIFIAGRPISEQRIYFASIGFCLLLANLFESLLSRYRTRALATILLSALLSFYLLIAARRSEYWPEEKLLWERTLEVSPTSWRSKLFLSAIYGEEEHFEEAIMLLKDIQRTLYPKPAKAFKELGVIYKKMQWDQRAMREFKKAVAIQPDYLEPRLLLGDIYRAMGKYNDAFEQYHFVERTWPLIGEGQLRLGILYKESEEYQKALQKFEEVLDLYPENTRALVNIASIYATQGKYTEAEEIFKSAIKSDPESVMAYNDYAIFLERRGRYDEAIDQYNKAIRIKPEEMFPHCNLAQLYLTRGEKANALLELMIAAQAHPFDEGLLEEINQVSKEIQKDQVTAPLLGDIVHEHCLLLNARGIYCGKVGKNMAAIECFQKLIEIQPHNGQAHANLGRVYSKIGKHEEALKELLIASEQLPKEASVFSSLGTCYAELGMMEEARKAWNRALELAPHAKEPRRNLARMRRLDRD